MQIIDFFELPVFHNASTDAGITLILNREPKDATKYFPVKSLDNLNFFYFSNLSLNNSLSLIDNPKPFF